ncbi:MAG: thioredoxin-disulfide reductase [Candidatus Shikimatogenerans bostrichidophilus]|nr:MAG: thioredoxin-disulfide reductase [Candidatus Shikimatogenerans bostrichidophilus]
MIKVFDCVIIGSGPAGYTSAIYLGRYNIKHVLYTGEKPGGQLRTTTKVENFPGFYKGILGYKLMDQMYKQAIKFGSIIKKEKIIKVIFKKYKEHILYTETKKKIKTKSVIIATGSLPKKLNIKSENKFIGFGISYCATCDGILFKKKRVAVIGGGETALEESLFLSNICKTIYLIVRKNKLKGSIYLKKKVKKKKNIKILFNKKVIKFLGKKTIKYIIIFNKKKNKKNKIRISCVFIAIGYFPNTFIFKNKIKMDNQGYIKTKNNSTKTNISGVFAAGDVQDKKYKQAITSAGSGCMAALDVKKFLF